MPSKKNKDELSIRQVFEAINRKHEAEKEILEMEKKMQQLQNIKDNSMAQVISQHREEVAFGVRPKRKLESIENNDENSGNMQKKQKKEIQKKKVVKPPAKSKSKFKQPKLSFFFQAS